MREAVIILPAVSQDATEALQQGLLSAYDGFTSDLVDGWWRDPETGKLYSDRSHRYTVAMEPTLTNAAKLHALALMAGRLAKQQAIYVRFADGGVELIDIPQEANAERAADEIRSLEVG